MKIYLYVALCVLLGCTQKYVDYDIVNKLEFDHQNYKRPIPTKPLLQGKSDGLSRCFNQWLFYSNAEKEKLNAIPNLVHLICPNDNYLVNTRVTETWWTLIFFSRACVDIEAHCPKTRE